ncbi:hypothetical protein NHX12_014444, partial [Muraenolepis orangiensis]
TGGPLRLTDRRPQVLVDNLGSSLGLGSDMSSVSVGWMSVWVRITAHNGSLWVTNVSEEKSDPPGGLPRVVQNNSVNAVRNRALRPTAHAPQLLCAFSL